MQEGDLPNFKKWLAENGATIVSPNANEALRFRHGACTGVVQRGKKGTLFPSDVVGAYFEAFTDNRPIPGARVQPSKTRSKIDILRERDGENCFYCDRPLGNDATREHLFSRAHGGNAHLANLALAHKHCNAEARHLPIVEKIKLRDERHRAAPVNVYGFGGKP